MPIAGPKSIVETVGGLSRLREGLGRDDAADADVDFQEIVEGDLRAGRSASAAVIPGRAVGASPEPITTGLSDFHSPVLSGEGGVYGFRVLASRAPE